MEEQPSRVITNLRKSGKLSEAWELGSTEARKNPDNVYVKGAFFWVCYDYLKEVQNTIKERAKSNKDNYKPNQAELDRINYLLDCIIWLNVPPGGFEYRSLLLVFQKNLEWLPKLVLLLVNHMDSLFEGEDKIPYQGEKGESPSLMLSFSRKVAKSWLDHQELGQINIEQLLVIFQHVRTQVRDEQNLIWLDYDEAKCLIKAGRLDQARDFVIPVLRNKQTESWAWGALAVTYREQDSNVAIILFAQGLGQVRDEKFALQLLKGIAPLLAGQGFEKEASMCVLRVLNYYHDNGWAIKSDLESLSRQPWFDSKVDINELSAFFKERSQGALSYLYGSTEQFVTVVMNIHESGKGFHVYRNQTKQYSVRLGLFRSNKVPRVGDYVRLSLSDDDLVISAEPCVAEKMEEVDHIEGNIKVNSNGYGFVDHTFVPANLISEGLDGKLVKILRVLSLDKSKNKPGWKALTLEVVSVL